MDQALIEYAVLAFIAGFVLFRLYTTLGKRVDSERPTPRPAPAQGEMPREQNGPQPMPAPMAQGPAGEGLMAIVFIEPESRVGRAVARRLFDGAGLAAIPPEILGDLRERIAAAYRAPVRDDTKLQALGRELVAALSANTVATEPDARIRKIMAWAGDLYPWATPAAP